MSKPLDRILKRIGKLHWVLNWSGNWPLLDHRRDEGYHRESKRISGTILTGTEAAFDENGIVTIFRTEEDFKRLDDFFARKFEKDPAFLVRSARGYATRVNQDLRALRAIHKIANLRDLSNQKLTALFKKARGHFDYNTAVDIYDWYMERVFTPMLERYLKEELDRCGKSDHLVEYLNTLITPHKISEIFRERTLLFSIVRYIRGKKSTERLIKSGATQEDIFRRDPLIQKKVESYFRKYLWMPVLVNNPPHTISSVWKEIRDLVLSGAPLVVQTRRLGDNYDRKIIARSKKYMKELNPPRRVRYIIEGLRAMAFLRTEDYWVMSESSYRIIPLYTEIGRRLGLSYQDLKEFKAEEITEHLRLGETISQEKLRARKRFNCELLLEGELTFFEEKEARVIRAAIDAQMRAGLENVTEFKGIAASKGKVRGKVKIAHDPKLVEAAKEGEVLVIATASAAFVPGMRKAAGIITEYGGLTSHPVIVAREFNIPCVVGIKGITHALKDGDMVEVDAEKGIIKILR
jgi:phosphohistidine swiveling domain-containing protein